MTLWIILTTMTAIAAVWAAVPFLRHDRQVQDAARGTRSSIVYRDQLRQVDTELQAGVIGESEASATRTEIARRLVLAERDEKSQSPQQPVKDRTFASIGIAGVVALASTILYVNIGEPDRIPSPPAMREATVANVKPQQPPRQQPGPSSNTDVTRPQPPQPAAAQPEPAGGGLATVDEMIERLSQRLKANPQDGEGWRMLGWSYASQQRFNEAASAYAEAIKLQPEKGDLYSAKGEALVSAGNGVVSPDAAGLFDEAVKRDKSNPRARFFLGLQKEQSGQRSAALDDWIAMLKEAPPGEGWAQELRTRVEQLAAQMNVDLSARLGSQPSASSPAGSDGPGILGTLQKQGTSPGQASMNANRSAPQGPSAAQVQSAQAMSPDDQSAMIRGMVDGLAARLEKQPNDVEGWSRLIRSRVVLKEQDKAKAALVRAREIFADKPDALATLGATARELGLDP